MGTMLSYSNHLYLSEGMDEKKLEKIKKKLHKRPLFARVTLIALSKNPIDQLDILDARQLCQGYYKKVETQVVGIASGYEEAVELVQTICKDCFRERQDYCLKEYLLCYYS